MTARTYDNDSVSWADPQVPLPDGGGIFAFTICTTAERLKQMLSVLHEGGAALGYGYIGAHNVDVIAALAEQPPPCANYLTKDDLQQLTDDLGIQVASLGGGCCGDECEEEGEEMPQIIKIGGVAYLANNCGCGDTELYPLAGPASVSVDVDGITSLQSQPDTGGYDFTPVGSEYSACVAASFVPYMLDRVINYQGLLVSLVSTTIDILNSFDEVLDVVTLAAAWLRGDADLSDWASILVDDVEAAFIDETFVAAMTQDFTDYWEGSPLTRDDLRFLAAGAPQFVNGVPVRWLMRDWVKYCKLDKLNEELAKFAAACEGGSVYPPPVLPDPTAAYQEWEHDGVTYPFWQWFPNVTLVHGTGTFAYIPPLSQADTGAIGAAVVGRAVGENLAHVHVDIGSTGTYTQLSVNATEGGIMTGNAAAMAALEAFAGLSFVSSNDGGGGWGTRISDRTGWTDWQVDRYIVIGEAL